MTAPPCGLPWFCGRLLYYTSVFRFLDYREHWRSAFDNRQIEKSDRRQRSVHSPSAHAAVEPNAQRRRWTVQGRTGSEIVRRGNWIGRKREGLAENDDRLGRVSETSQTVCRPNRCTTRDQRELIAHRQWTVCRTTETDQLSSLLKLNAFSLGTYWYILQYTIWDFFFLLKINIWI